ncbi:MAG: hypothetical protein PHV30_09235 [Candidatus Margulisbacteria bacterium]|nr:hypothetical protein [Candidatus Margulisiibacteriota bacterium]
MNNDRESFSRKELSGWGDSNVKINQQLSSEELSNIINPNIEETYKGELLGIIDVVLLGLHLETYETVLRKYKAEVEETIEVKESLRNILLKRSLKKLSSILN